jgi:YD repeat-containing protein
MICKFSYSQSSSIFDQASKVPLLTPEAASFAKYVEFPVSLYNGVPNISIPLYTIQSGDISVPITLSYHAGGIKVSEEASWVGLGWNLDAGGMISRQINGHDDWDNASNDYFGQLFFSGNLNYDEMNGPTAVYGACWLYDKNGNSIQQTLGSGLLNLINFGEGEPDTYIYNFGPFNGKFINPDQVHDFVRSNIKFNVQVNSITAQTPDGYLYEFNDLEMSRANNPAYYSITGFHLSRITSPKGKVMNFTYETLTSQRMLDTYSEQYTTSYPVNFGAGGDPGTLSQKLQANDANLVYLAKIDFDEGYIDFIRDTRTDISGKRLTQINIKYKDGTLLKSFNFNQTYFTGSSTNYYPTPDANYPYVPGYPDSYINTRLRLDALVETGTDPNILPRQYTFDYNDGGVYTLPYKTSWAADYWGYYNGAAYNTTFIPSSKGFQLSSVYPTVNDYPGANREPSEEYMKAGTLKKITYPTKGSTEYSYSAHQFTNAFIAPVKIRTVLAAFATDAGQAAGVQQATFTLGSPTNVKMDVKLYCNCPVVSCLCGPSALTWDCGGMNGDDANVLYAEILKLNSATGTYDFIDGDHNWDGTDVLQNCSQEFQITETLQAGTYKIIVNYPDNKEGNYGSKMASMTVQYDETYYDPVMTGGGLRISQIKHHDPIQNTDLVSSYEYYNGTLMNFPTFYWSKVNYTLDAQTNTYVPYKDEYLYGNSIIPFSTSANGSNVGYGRVIEKRENGVGGWTEYLYENYADNTVKGQPSFFDFPNLVSYSPGEPTTTHLKNGFLKEETQFDNAGNPIRKTVKTSQVLLGESYWSFKKEIFNDAGNLAFDPNKPCDTFQAETSMFYFYPIQMGKVVPTQSVEYDYSKGSQLVKTTTFSYNAFGDKSIEQITGSDGKVISTEYKYLNDYVTTSGWLKDLSDKNKRDAPLETYNKVNGNVIGGSFIEYGTVNGKTLPFHVYQIETTNPSSIASTAPNAFLPNELKLKGTIVNDANGNISYTMATNNMVTSYLWGYNNTFPIAIVQNATPTQIYHTSFEEITSNFSTTSFTGLKSYSGTAPFTVPLPSAGTYKLTYWIKNGTADWQPVSTTMTSSTSIGGGSNVLIDEVRVYPDGAQMTTYAYDVLLGLTYKTDSGGAKTSYQFDGLGRLQAIKDKDGNILKLFEYHD